MRCKYHVISTCALILAQCLEVGNQRFWGVTQVVFSLFSFVLFFSYLDIRQVFWLCGKKFSSAAPKAGLPLRVPAMCSAMAGATPCLHPHGHKGKCIHQHCIMGVTLLRVFPPFQGGGFLTAHHGCFFCLLFTTTVQGTEQPSVHPPHYSGAQEPCQPIDVLRPPPLLQEHHQSIDNLSQLLLHFLSR